MTKKSWLIIAVVSLLLVGCSKAVSAGIGESIFYSNVNEEELNDLIDVAKVQEQNESETLESNEKIKNENKEESEDIKVNSNSNSTSDSQKKENSKNNQDENIITNQKDESKDKDDSEKTETVKTEENKKQEEKKEDIVEEKVLSSNLSQSAIELINKKRSEAGLNQLSYSSYLGNIALERAKQIVDDFSHNRFYSNYQSKDYKLGECLAYGYGSAQNAVNGWMASSAHRNVLMDAENVSIGIAYCGEYWVAIVSY